MTQHYTDIDLSGFIGKLPKHLRAYALLMRLDRPWPALLLFFPGAFGIFLAPDMAYATRLFYCAIVLIGSILMRSAGCVVNDMWDRNLDKRVERTRLRPLANGDLNLSQAFALLGVLLALGASLLWFLPAICFELVPLALILGGLYPLAKRFTPFPQLVMGFAFGFSAIMGYAAVAREITYPALMLYGAVILWQTGYDTIYGYQDMRDDIKIGIKSLSLLTHKAPRVFLAAVYGGTCVLTIMALKGAFIAPAQYLWFVPAFLCLARQIYRVNPSEPALCLNLFKSNVAVGAWALAAFMLIRA